MTHYELEDEAYFNACFNDFWLKTQCVAILIGVLLFIYFELTVMNSHEDECDKYPDDYKENEEYDECARNTYEHEYVYEHMSYNEIPKELENRMKFYEEQSQEITVINKRSPFIVRLDGILFSKFTSKLKSMTNEKVYLKEFRNAMQTTACDLLLKFNPTTVYTHSDEITLIFPDCVTYDNDGYELLDREHYRGGKVFKLLTEIASTTSTSFTRNIRNQFKDNEEVTKFLLSKDVSFDARLIVFPNSYKYDIANHMIWRTRDCYRNYVSDYAKSYFGSNKMHKVTTENRKFLLKEKGVDLDNDEQHDFEELSMKYGLFLKKFGTSKESYIIQTFYTKKLYFSPELLDFLLIPLNELLLSEYQDENKDCSTKKLTEFEYEHYTFCNVFDATTTRYINKN